MTYYKNIIKGVDKIGDLTTLKTKNKDNIVEAVNELNTNLSKSENNKYSTVNGIKEFTCGQNGYIDNIYIEGKTEINLISEVRVFSVTESNGNIWTSGGNKSVSNSNGVYSFTTSDTNQWDDCGNVVPVKPNTQYTFSVNVIDGLGTRTIPMVAFFTSKPTIDKSLANQDIFIKVSKGDTTNISNGKKSFTFITPDNCTYIACIVSCELAKSVYKFSEFLLVEGDKSLPYFEGVKSIGQGDMIELLTYNKQNKLFDINGKNVIDGQYIESIVTNSLFGTIRDNSSMCYIDEFIEVEPNKTYIFENANYSISQYDNNKQIIDIKEPDYLIPEVDNRVDGLFCLSTTYKTKYIKLSLRIRNKNLFNYYNSQGFDKKQIFTTLRSINGIKDEIIKRDNKYYKVKRCDEVTLKGTENTILLERTGTDTLGFVIKDVLINHKSTWNSINCDKLPVIVVYGNDLEGIQSNNSNPTWVHIGIDKTVLETADVDGFKKWLLSNPITIVYELKNPILEELFNFNPQIFEGSTSLLINTGIIQGDILFESSDGLYNEMNVIKNKISNTDTSLLSINNTINSEYFIKSQPKKYFSSITTEKDLDNIKYNLMAYTTKADALLNLPNGKTGGAGFLEVHQTYNNSGKQHTVQRFTDSATNDFYQRSYNKDNDEWTEWKRIASLNNISNPNLLLNGTFNIWQRGTSFSNTTCYTADRWRLYNYTKGIVVSKDSEGMKLTSNGTNYSMLLTQALDARAIPCLWGKDVTLSVDYKVLSGNPKIRAEIRYSDGENDIDNATNREYSRADSVSGSTEGTVVCTFKNLASGKQSLSACIAVSHYTTDSFEVIITGAKLEAGDVATPIKGVNYAEELLKCQYYYEQCAIVQTMSIADNGQIVANLYSNVPVKRIDKPNVKLLTEAYAKTHGSVGYKLEDSYITFKKGGGLEINTSASSILSTKNYTINSIGDLSNVVSTAAYVEVDAEIY